MNEGYPALIWAARRGKIEALQFLVENGAFLDICDSEGLTVLDQAIINAQYPCAVYLKRQGQVPKSIEFYQLNIDRFLFEEVDFALVLKHLEEDSETFSEGLMKPREDRKVRFNDPVLDPNQSWSDIFKRMKSFQAPKMVFSL